MLMLGAELLDIFDKDTFEARGRKMVSEEASRSKQDHEEVNMSMKGSEKAREDVSMRSRKKE